MISRLHRGCLYVATSILATMPAMATDSAAELDQVKQKLLQWLPGDYSTRPQLALERALGTPPSGEHEDWYRIFAPINAPQVGEHVIYGQLHSGGRDGPIIPGTQVLYIVSIDEEHRAVNVSGRRVLNPQQYDQKQPFAL